MEKRYVTLGDLIADLYYINKKMVGFDGGGSKFNVIANLTARGEQTAIIGGCGNDKVGNSILKRYRELGVDTSNVNMKEHNTRAYNLVVKNEDLPHVSYNCLKISPITHKSTWYNDDLKEINEYQNFVDENDIIILDKADNVTIEIINNLKNDKVLDIGSLRGMQRLSNKEIEELRGKLNLLQLNERVVPYLMSRFNFTNINEIYELFKPDLLTITKGKEGADFIYNGKIIHKRIEKCGEELDPTGAGDAFFSVFISEYFKNNKKIDDNMINKTFKAATYITSKVVRCLGARGHIYEIIQNKTKNERMLDQSER